MFVVTAYRYGDTERHSYVVGIANTLDRAKKWADAETEYRGGKYECQILQMRVNETFREDNRIVVKDL